MKTVKSIASVNKQPHGVVHPSLHKAEQQQLVKQAAKQNRDLERVEKQHLRGFEK